MSAIAQCVKKNALSVSFFYGSDLNTSTQKELTCGLLRGEPRETVRVFSFHERVSNHVSLKEREDLTPFLFSTRVSLVACGDILKKKKKEEERRKRNRRLIHGQIGRFSAAPGASEPASPPLRATQISFNFLRTLKQKSKNKQTNKQKKTSSWPPSPPAVITCQS